MAQQVGLRLNPNPLAFDLGTQGQLLPQGLGVWEGVKHRKFRDDGSRQQSTRIRWTDSGHRTHACPYTLFERLGNHWDFLSLAKGEGCSECLLFCLVDKHSLEIIPQWPEWLELTIGDTKR